MKKKALAVYIFAVFMAYHGLVSTVRNTAYGKIKHNFLLKYYYY